jgi:hypothetical protein
MIRLISLVAFALLAFPTLAFADAAPPPQDTLALPTDQVWTLVAGALAPLASYVLNYVGPQTSERVKAFVQVVVAAVAGGLTQAIAAGSDTVGFNSVTLQFVLSAVIAALTAHKFLWQPSTISTALGGGRNKDGVVA